MRKTFHDLWNEFATLGLFGMGGSASTAPAVFVGSLDAYESDLSAAWSVARRLLSTYEGPLIRVRRSSDNAEADIGCQANGEIDVSDLLSFVSGGDGFLVTAYGQKGLHNYAQSNPVSQPKIVHRGMLITSSSTKPACLLDGMTDVLQCSTLTQSQPWSMYAIWADYEPSNYGVLLARTGVATGIGVDPSNRLFLYGSTGFERQITRETNLHCDQFIANGTLSQVWRDGVQLGADGTTNATLADTLYMGSESGSARYDFKWSESVVFHTALSPAELEAISAETALFYHPDPLSCLGLSLHLKSDVSGSVFTDTTGTVPAATQAAVANWTDKITGDGEEILQSDLAKRPLLSMDGVESVTNAATIPWMETSLPLDTRSFSLFFLGYNTTIRQGFSGGVPNEYHLLFDNGFINLHYAAGNSLGNPTAGYGRLQIHDGTTWQYSAAFVPASLCLIGIVGSATGAQLIINGQVTAINALAPDTRSSAKLLGNTANMALNGGIKEIFQADRALTSAEISLLQSYAHKRGVVAAPARQIVFSGDSITMQVGSSYNQGFVRLCIKALPESRVYCTAQGSITLQTLLAEIGQWENAIVETHYSERVLVLFAGTNDIALSVRSPAEVYADTVSMGNAAKTAGYTKVIIVGMLPRIAVNASRAALRSLLLADFDTAAGAALVFSPSSATYADLYIDLGGDMAFGQDGHEANGALYPDGVHPSSAVHAAIASYLLAALA